MKSVMNVDHYTRDIVGDSDCVSVLAMSGRLKYARSDRNPPSYVGLLDEQYNVFRASEGSPESDIVEIGGTCIRCSLRGEAVTIRTTIKDSLIARFQDLVNQLVSRLAGQ